MADSFGEVLGCLLDLACGPGQVALPLSARFRQVWALDREPGMIEVGRRRAAAQSVTNLEWRLGRAEDLEAPAGAFELITIGNAFHRLHRRLIGHGARSWLVPTGRLAVLGSNSLWTGTEDWQAIARDVLRKWRSEPASVAQGWRDRTYESFEEALYYASFGVHERLCRRLGRWMTSSAASIRFRVYRSACWERRQCRSKTT